MTKSHIPWILGIVCVGGIVDALTAQQVGVEQRPCRYPRHRPRGEADGELGLVDVVTRLAAVER